MSIGMIMANRRVPTRAPRWRLIAGAVILGLAPVATAREAFASPAASKLIAARGLTQASTRAIYTVPAPEALSDVATLPVSVYAVDEGPAGTELLYALPEDLTGDDPLIIRLRLETRTADGMLYFVGPLGEALCRGMWSQLDCSLLFADLPLSPAHVDARLTRRYGDDAALLAKKRRIAAHFRGEPVGFLHAYPAP